MANKSPEEKLASFIARYSPEVRAVAHQAMAHLRQRLPGANELVYDNYNALAIGFAPTDRASDAVLSIALYPRWVNLFFLHGATLSDPHKILEGSGQRVRRILIEDAATLNRPAVRSLITAAVKASAIPFNKTNRGQIIIKAVAVKQRPRRPA